MDLEIAFWVLLGSVVLAAGFIFTLMREVKHWERECREWAHEAISQRIATRHMAIDSYVPGVSVCNLCAAGTWKTGGPERHTVECLARPTEGMEYL